MASIGATPELVIGIAAGAAASAALEPALEIPKQDAWDGARNRILDPGLLARLVAQGGVTLDIAHYYAHRQGYDDDQFAGLVYLSQAVPGIAEALTLWRLGIIKDGPFKHVLVKSGLEQQYVDAIMQTKKDQRPGIGDIAYSVVRGYLPTDITLPVAPPSQAGLVPRFPQSNVKAETWAEQIGFDSDALELMIARSGLSMAPGMAANGLFRSNAAATISNLPNIPGVSPFAGQPYLNSDDYSLAISEGDLRTEWGDAVLQVSRQILTAGEYAELELRGYIDGTTRRALTSQHGMSHFDSDLLYDVQGRGLSLRNAMIGSRRGGTLDGPTDNIPDWAMYQLQRGNLRPEVFNLAWHARESYPSAFVIRALLSDGAISETEGHDLLYQSGWPDALATTVAQHYAAKSGGSTNKHVTAAQGQLWTTTHTAYKNGEIDWAEAAQNLTALGISAADQNAIKTLWDAERDTYRKQLTPTQIKKAWSGAVVNPATGVAWTKDDALAALIGRGYSPNDANTFLEL